jgi:hypothetical protein
VAATTANAAVNARVQLILPPLYFLPNGNRLFWCGTETIARRGANKKKREAAR